MLIPYRAVLWAGLICGVLDGISATVVATLSGTAPMQVFQAIATGLLGKIAYKGGIETMLLGIAIHFVVAFGAANVYYSVAQRFPLLISYPLACGVAYGVLVHLFMTFLVIPLSKIGPRPFAPKSFTIYLLISMVVIGPSIALSLRHFARVSTRGGFPRTVRVRRQ